MWFGADPNARERRNYGFSLLWLAARTTSVEAVEALLVYGADPNWAARSQVPVAGVASNVDILRALLDAGADLDDVTVLEHAIESEDLAMVDLLISQGVDLDVELGDDMLLPRFTIEYGSAAILDRCLRHGVPIHQLGHTHPILSTDVTRKPDMLRVLLDHGADPNYDDGHEELPVWSAITWGSAESLQLLIERGADITWTYDLADKPLTVKAIEKKYAKKLEVLLSNGLSARWSDPENNDTLLKMAVKNGDVATTRVLLRHGAHLPTDGGRVFEMLVYAAVDKGSHEVVKVMLEYAASTALTYSFDGFYSSPTYHAIERHDSATLKVLLAHGVSVDWRSDRGQTLLTLATELDAAACLQLLVEAGGNDSEKRSGDQSLLDLATEKKALNAARVLLDAGMTDIRDYLALTRLAFEQGDLEFIWRLTEHGICARLSPAEKKAFVTLIPAKKFNVIIAILRTTP